MINIGFIGLGDMGMCQVRTFLKVRGAKIVAGADVSNKSRTRFSEHVPGAAVYADHRDLLGDGRVDAVVVVVPTYYHDKIAINALKSGRPVLVEKPMARTVAGARRMNDIARSTGQLLMVAQCRRHDEDWGKFADIYRRGMLGHPILWRHVLAGFGPGPSWFCDEKLGGGPLMDGAVHDQDFANMLFGDPVRVQASGIKLTNASAMDSCTAVVHYPRGDQLMLSWSWGVAPSGGGVQDALGTAGSVQFNPRDLEGPGIDTKKFGYYRITTRRTRKSKLIRFRRRDMYVTQGQHFLDCIAGKAKCITPGTEAIKAVAVGNAILKAGPKGGSMAVRW